MAIGKVAWFNDAKGFGFIETAEGDQVFVHYSAIDNEGFKSLRPGQPVKFDVYDGKKGPLAKNVSRLDH